ncbi:MAG: phosphonate C-P lyase system protein PhnG [Burkholderiaceae bacterium]|nr:phosphonate C-P lyase system protein PhnG [Burkholderiaceae bacterium]
MDDLDCHGHVLLRAEACLTRMLLIPLDNRYEFLRRAEPGMVMLRARSGAPGTRSIWARPASPAARCAFRRYTGTGYVLGRERRKAELVALFDALLQDPQNRPGLDSSLLRVLRERQRRQRADKAQAAVRPRSSSSRWCGANDACDARVAPGPARPGR